MYCCDQTVIKRVEQKQNHACVCDRVDIIKRMCGGDGDQLLQNYQMMREGRISGT